MSTDVPKLNTILFSYPCIYNYDLVLDAIKSIDDINQKRKDIYTNILNSYLLNDLTNNIIQYSLIKKVLHLKNKKKVN